MTVSNKEALSIAHRWVRSQSNLPAEFELKEGRTPSEDKYLFLVDKFHQERRTRYRFLVLGVFKADGSVAILNDRRDYVRSLIEEATWTQWMDAPRIDPKAVATAIREKLLEAVKEPYENKPGWFLGLTPVSPGTQSTGVAVVAEVLIKGIPARIPVHINRSAAAQTNYIERNQSLIQGGMAVVIIESNTSLANIRSRLFNELGQKRRGDYNFEKLLKKFRI